MLKSPRKFKMPFINIADWRPAVLLMVLSLSFFSFFSLSPATLNSLAPLNHFLAGLRVQKIYVFNQNVGEEINSEEKKEELMRSRMAVCLVGGARRFELTGPSIMAMILKEYPNSDLFLNSPLDPDSYKFSLLKNASRIAAVRIFRPQPLPENEVQARVLTSSGSPNGIQGLLQYFDLVEGCLRMIKSHQLKNNFTYDWVVRTRVDGYWNAPLHPENFVRGQYLVPPGSSYGGLNDRLGIGDIKSSTVALSRLSVLPYLDSVGLQRLNSESTFKAQLTTQGVRYITKRLPFCILSDRKYDFPPARYGVPVAAMSSRGPLSGAKCRPCTPACQGVCVGDVMMNLDRDWSWTNWENGTLELCDARESWEKGWEKIFDRVAGQNLAAVRRRVRSLTLKGCVEDFGKLKNRTASWDSPPIEDICTLGLGQT